MTPHLSDFTQITDNSTKTSRLSFFLIKYEKLIPIFLFLLFLVINVPGTSKVWNPDELAHRVNKALHGEWRFDETNFDYPSLPKYVMYGVGSIVYKLGYSSAEYYLTVRLVSLLLGALSVILVYKITRRTGGSILTGVFASVLTLTNSELAINSRFAHNDLYLTISVLLIVYSLAIAIKNDSKLCLYAAFVFVGFAASSKYNGGILILVLSRARPDTA